MEKPSAANYRKAEGVITNANAIAELKRHRLHGNPTEAKKYLIYQLAEKYRIKRKTADAGARAGVAFNTSISASGRAAASAGAEAGTVRTAASAPSTATSNEPIGGSETPSEFFERLAEGTSRRVAAKRAEILNTIASLPVGRLVSTGPSGIPPPGRRNIRAGQQRIVGNSAADTLAALAVENIQVKKLAENFSAVKLKKGGYRATRRDKKYLKLYKQGKSIGFTMRSSLKAKGLIPRANGTQRVSKKYRG
jgi:hypothetical protein